MYIEFAGLDSHDAAWKNTASYKMLTGTTLGEVLEAVSEQLLEKALSFVPGHRLSGTDIVKLAKYSARSGWVVAVNADAKARSGFRGTFVLRGGAGKDNRALTSPMMGWLMGASKAKVESKAGRDLVIVPVAGAQANANDAGGWVWWAEKEDLVIGFLDPGSAEASIAVLDGKAAGAVDHPVVKELAVSQGKFEPVCFGFLDPAVGMGDSSNGLATLLHSLQNRAGDRSSRFPVGIRGRRPDVGDEAGECQTPEGAARGSRRADLQQGIAAAVARSGQVVRGDLREPEALRGADQADGAIETRPRSRSRRSPNRSRAKHRSISRKTYSGSSGRGWSRISHPGDRR